MSADSSLALLGTQPEQSADEPHFALTIEPTKGWAPLNLKALWRYRELLYFLTWRDVKVRYKQTALGAAWAVLQPVMTMVLFTVVFGHFPRIPSDAAPYPVFNYCVSLPSAFFP